MNNNNIKFDSGFGTGSGQGYGYGTVFGFGYGDSDGNGYGSGYDSGYGDTDSWIKIGQINDNNVSVLSQWPYMKIGDEIKSLENWNQHNLRGKLNKK